MQIIPQWCAAILLLGAAQSATAAKGDSPNPKDYERFATEKVEKIQFSSLYGWEPIDAEHVVLFTGVRKAWLLDLSGLCLDFDLNIRINVTSFGQQIHSGFDKVQTQRGECRIQQIRKIDMEAYDQAKRQVLGGDLELGNASDLMSAEAIERPAGEVDAAERSGG